MTTETIHTCSYECERPECIRAQRDELVARLTATQQQEQAARTNAPVGVERLLADLETIWHSVSDDKETNAAYERLKIAIAQQPAAVDEAAAIRAFEEHFEASAEDPYFEGELKLWLTAWRKAIAAQQQEASNDHV